MLALISSSVWDWSVGEVSINTSSKDPILENHILIWSQRLSPLDSWNFDGIISSTFTLDYLTNCKYLGLIFGSNRSILQSRRFYDFVRCKECFNFLIGRNILCNLELGFKCANLGLQLILGRYFVRLPVILALYVSNIFPLLGIMPFILFGVFLLS